MVRRSVVPFPVFLCILLIFIVINSAWAGSVVIHVETETGGCVRAVGTSSPDCDNLDGAIFWNGTGWGVNDTYGHMYFTHTNCSDPSAPPECVEGARIKDFVTTAAPSQATESGVEILREAGPEGMEYRAVHNIYSYNKTYQGTKYEITAAEIVVQMVSEGTTTPTGPMVVLRSRSANVSAPTPYFDVYIQNENDSTEAFRGDPAWFHYDLEIEQALTQTSYSAGKMGDMPTANSQYWLDIDGGSEMGGKTFKLITGDLTDTELDGLQTSFISQIAVQYTDGEAVLRELLFTPHVYSIHAVLAGAAVPSMSQWGMVFMVLFLAIPAVRVLKKSQLFTGV